jgi:hypothetical protein
VVQVADGNDTVITKTDVVDCIRILENTFNRPLLPGKVVHTFNAHSRNNLPSVDEIKSFLKLTFTKPREEFRREAEK